MPAWSIQTGVAPTHHTVLKRISMNAFVSAVATALLTRVLLVFPSSALPFVFLPLPRLPPLGQLKGDALFLGAPRA